MIEVGRKGSRVTREFAWADNETGKMFGRKGKQSLELDAGDIGKQGGSTPQKDVESVSGGMDTKQDGDDINIDLSGARRRSRRASASDVLVPRWLHIMHYVVHAVFLLLLILLIIAIAMVETDAKDDGEDGVVNSILKAFKLQVCVCGRVSSLPVHLSSFCVQERWTW